MRRMSGQVGVEPGFEILFRTCDDSRIARMRADWLVPGQVLDEDDWEVSQAADREKGPIGDRISQPEAFQLSTAIRAPA